MENYIMLNGKRIDLTAEQIETLVGAIDPFKEGASPYYFINSMGELKEDTEVHDIWQEERYAVANHCTDKELMEQRALHETLSRLLWRYSMQHGGREIDWNDNSKGKWLIYFAYPVGKFNVAYHTIIRNISELHFATRAAAESAIEEIVKPFMEKHPEFRW